MKEQKEKGITLIALVVTIIILLILAGVTISSVISNEGLFARANKATVAYVHETVKEAMNLQYTDYIAEKVEQNNSKTLISYLQGKEIIGEEESGKYRINVEKLLGGRQSLGNGTGETDVYKLEDITEELKTGEVTIKETGKVATTEPIKIAEESSSDKTYRLMYYGKNASENVELSRLTDSNETEEQDIAFQIQDKNFTVKKGTTWRKFAETSQLFFVDDNNIVNLTQEGESFFELNSNVTYYVWDLALEVPEGLYLADILIENKEYTFYDLGG